MSISLPKPIAAYFNADRHDAAAVAHCFTESAVVIDEGQTHSGLAAIRQWKTETTNKYTYSVEPLASQQKEGKTIVTSRVTGNFPGGQIDLRFIFELKGDKISFLEIIP